MPTFEWIGKEKVINHHQEVPYKVLDRKYSFDVDGEHMDDNGSENMIIHGDNLIALKSLLPQYEGKIKCIYIDPPYNTGKENWVYNDNVNDPRIKEWLGEVVGKEGEDLSRHDKWLCMMYPRLELLYKLLEDDGAIFISIDYNEHANLIKLMNEIFGEKNYIDSIVWDKKSSAKGVPTKHMLSHVHEYIVVYQKKGDYRFIGEKRTEAEGKFKNPDNDPRGPWRESNIKSTTTDKSFTITDPTTGKHYTNTWAFSEESLNKMIKENRILWKESLPKQKEFLYEMKNENKAIKSSWGVFDPQSTTVFLKNIISDIKFDNPKPINLMRYLVKVALGPDDIILDSFAGSGTTAQAVLDTNKEDGGHRKFILVELMDYANTLTAERVKRVIEGYNQEIEVEEDLFDQKITAKDLKNGSDILEDAKAISQTAKASGIYIKVSQPKMVDGHLKVIGTKKVNETVEGTGQDFSFYELGEPLLKGDNLNENVEIDKIREYIWYTETKQPYKDNSNINKYYIGSSNQTAYYFFYEPGQINTLDYNLITNVTIKADNYVIYADKCVLSEDELTRLNINFKKIPRDITRV